MCTHDHSPSSQAGLHNTDGNKRRSWGHALAFDPWGEAVATLDDGAEGVGVAVFDIDQARLQPTTLHPPPPSFPHPPPAWGLARR